MASGTAVNRQLSAILDLEGRIEWNVFRLGRDFSATEAFASHHKALEEQGFEITFLCARSQCGSNFIRRTVDLNGWIAPGGERWSQDSGYYFLARYDTPAKKEHFALLSYLQPDGLPVVRQLRVSLETPGFDQIQVSAQSMADDIEKAGKVAVYGIYFDVDKHELRVESRPTLAEISRLLEMRPEMSLYVDGHTDDQGDTEYNLELSQLRAAAVVNALVSTHGVEAARLESRGFGEGRPIGDNISPEGRRQNRRVELVAKTGGID